MPRSVALAKTISIRFPKDLADKVEKFGAERSMSYAQAIRYIVEDHFEEEPRRQQTRKSLNRLMEINEYVFASIFETNKKTMPQEKRRELLAEVAESIQRYHPEV
jgi:predicted DNA-binding protein